MTEGVELATAYVSLVASTKDLAPSVAKQFQAVEKDADKAGKRIGGRLSSGIGGSLKMLGAAGLALGVKDFFGDAISEARESQKVGAVTASIIKSTGGAAKISADQVGDLATALSNKTGMDDEAIQSGANMLLTFKNVRNEVGQGANIFDRATAAAADLSAAGFGDMAGQSKMLGKALNDPMKGISALSRSGVTFTEQQKKQIKTLVESGKTLDAQKIILKEVESQVGGTAAASATAGEKLATTWGNFKEGIGTALLPVIDGAMQAGSRFLGWLMDAWPPAWESIKAAVGPAFEFIKNIIGSAIAWIRAFWTQHGAGIVAQFRSVFNQVQATVSTVFGQVKTIIATVFGWIKTFWDAWGSRILATLASVWGKVRSIIDGALRLVRGIFQTIIGIITGDWSKAWDGIKGIVSGAWTIIKNVIGAALDYIKLYLSMAWSAITGVAGRAWEGVKAVIAGAWNGVKSVISAGVGWVKNILSSAWSAVSGVAVGAWNGIVSAISGAWNKVVDVVGGPIRRVLQFIQENLIDKINGVLSFLHVPFRITSIWTADRAAHGFSNSARNSGKNKSFDVGGYTGSGPRFQPAGIVHAGEVVWDQQAVAGAGGWRNVEALRIAAKRGQALMPGYASGGMVKPVNARPIAAWGRYPSGGLHRALDLPVPIGTPVRAPYAGTVIRDGWDNTGFGTHLRLRHTNGTYSILGHLLRENMNVGDSFSAGQVLAQSGNSGRSTGPHLHFEMRRSPYDPSSAFNFTSAFNGGTLAGGGPALNFGVSDVVGGTLKGLLKALASPAKMGLRGIGGPWGEAAAGTVDNIIDGAIDAGMDFLFGETVGEWGSIGGQRNEIRPTLYDTGGVLPPGLSLVSNQTGRPEVVLPPDMDLPSMFDELIDEMRALVPAIGEATKIGARDGLADRNAAFTQGMRQGANRTR